MRRIGLVFALLAFLPGRVWGRKEIRLKVHDSKGRTPGLHFGHVGSAGAEAVGSGRRGVQVQDSDAYGSMKTIS